MRRKVGHKAKETVALLTNTTQRTTTSIDESDKYGQTEE